MASASSKKYQEAITPYLVCKDAIKSIDFYKEAFGAKILSAHMAPANSEMAGKCMHAELLIEGHQSGASLMFLCEECPQMNSKSPKSLGGTPISLYLCVADCDAVYQQAVKCGAKSLKEPADMFWGDRWALIESPDGHIWNLGQPKEVLTDEELTKRQATMMTKVE